MKVTDNQGDSGFGAAITADVALKTKNAKVPPSCGKVSFSKLANRGFGTHLSIIDRTKGAHLTGSMMLISCYADQ